MDTYKSLVKSLTGEDLELPTDSLEAVTKSIKQIESLEINFIKNGFSESVMHEFFEVKAKLLLNLKYLKQRYESERSTENESSANEFVKSNAKFEDFLEILKQNENLAIYIAQKETDPLKKFAMQINIQRALTKRKFLFTNKGFKPVNKSIDYPDTFDFKLSRMSETSSMPSKEDTVIELVVKNPKHVYLLKELSAISETTGINKKMIDTTMTIKEDLDCDYISPLDIESSSCLNWIDPVLCSYEDILRPLFVKVNTKMYLTSCINDIQLLAPELESYVSKKIIQAIRSHKNEPSKYGYQEIYMPKVKHFIKKKLEDWTRPEDKVLAVDQICEIIVDAVVDNIKSLPDEILMMAKVAAQKLAFKERKTIMDSYKFLSAGAAAPLILDIVDNNAKKFKDLNENIEMFCKIIL